MPRRVTLLSAALTAAAVLSLAAQDPPQKPADPQRPTFRTEANYVRVDVFPTLDGVPVRDLTRAEFEVLEDGVPQKIDAFEFVQVRAGMPGERRDPNTIAESRDALKDPRARVFVLFLDVPHVTIHGSWNVREPLVRLIDRILAPEDLIGIMTPRMAASDIVFARKTEVVAGGLRDRWPWGERFTLADDEREIMYTACYPWATDDMKAAVTEMIARREERMTLDSLSELVHWLRDQREERKAILTMSEGWWLYGRNDDLTRPRVIDPRTGQLEPIPGPEPIGTGPDGRIRIGNTLGAQTVTKTECDRDRQYLSQIDNERYFRDIIDDANRANASFYTVDPRGLPVFDTPIGPDPPPPPSVDQAILKHRLDTLQVLANNTDGLAVVNSNDLEKGLRRMADDLTSYYLLGYYSTNTKLDGRFRTIKVRVNRPGIDVRARKGYKAATEKEATDARKAAAPPPVPEHVTAARNALTALARLRGSSPFHAQAIVVADDVSTVWVAGELGSGASAPATAEVSASAGEATASATVPLVAGQRAFVAPVVFKTRVTEPVDVRVRVTQASGLPLTDMIRVEPGAGLPEPIMFRRGPATGNRVAPAGQPVFSRTERARFDVALTGDTKVTAARILDRNGTAIELPVTLSERTDADGKRWTSADVVLAPLAAGDYIVEISATVGGAEQKRLTAFRVTR
jgi:VWFA-related protein